MAFDTVALFFGAAMALPGLIFMAKNTETVGNAIKESKLESAVNPKMLGIASYYLFLAGMILFALGGVILGLAIELPPALAVPAGLAGPLTVLGYMAIMKESITGIPGIMGPPLPARIALIVIGLVINANVIVHAIDGEDDPWIAFGVLYLVCLSVPHLVALKHRKAGWEKEMV